MKGLLGLFANRIDELYNGDAYRRAKLERVILAEINAAAERGFQHAVNLLRSDEANAIEVPPRDAHQWADWLEGKKE